MYIFKKLWCKVILFNVIIKVTLIAFLRFQKCILFNKKVLLFISHIIIIQSLFYSLYSPGYKFLYESNLYKHFSVYVLTEYIIICLLYNLFITLRRSACANINY